jgi:hypothetical protein
MLHYRSIGHGSLRGLMALHIHPTTPPGAALQACSKCQTRNVLISVTVDTSEQQLMRLFPYLCDNGLRVIVASVDLEHRPLWIEFCHHLSVVVTHPVWVPHKVNEIIYRPLKLAPLVIPSASDSLFNGITKYLDAPASAEPVDILDFLTAASPIDWLLDRRALDVEVQDPKELPIASVQPPNKPVQRSNG